MQQIKNKEDILDNISAQWIEAKGKFSAESLPHREQAFETFQRQGFPSNKNEEYKYTPITKALEKEFSFKEINQSASIPTLEEVKEHFVPGLEGNILVFVNGRYSKDYSAIKSSSDLLEVHSLKQAYQEAFHELTPGNKPAASIDQDPFKQLNNAFAEEGVFVKIPDGKVLDQPLVIYFISDTRNGKSIQQVQNFIVIGKNSQADIIEYHKGTGDNASFVNTSTEIFVHENAVGSYCKVENEGEKSIHADNTTVHQDAKSVFTALSVNVEGGMIRNNLNITLNDEYCEANMFGLYLLRKRQHVDNHTTVDHKKPNCLSNELYKGIMDDNATGVFNGKIYVRPDAQKTNAFQSNKNILLSDDATINTKPQLEIWADDVKCSHGATTGQLDEEQLFYLRARGLGKETAKAMLLYAFAIDVLDKVKQPALKEYLDNIISSRLQK